MLGLNLIQVSKRGAQIVGTVSLNAIRQCINNFFPHKLSLTNMDVTIRVSGDIVLEAL